jgi:hypothetical protein
VLDVRCKIIARFVTLYLTPGTLPTHLSCHDPEPIAGASS